MEIKDYIESLENYPVLFVGTGLSLRYGKNAYTWEGLLQSSSKLIYDNDFEYDQMYEMYKEEKTPLLKIASKQEEDYTKKCNKRDESTAEINKIWDEITEEKPSRYKLILYGLIKEIKLKEDLEIEAKHVEELEELVKASKNIMSVVTTNYDSILESVIEYLEPSFGNDIYFSNVYGSIYKIHGDCTSINNVNSMIITEQDYKKFETNYQLIKAHLISLFIHNPIIFVGYGIKDTNIQDILSTIFKYVDINSSEGMRIKNNFLLVEWDAGSENTIITEHTIITAEGIPITIKMLKTDNYKNLYTEISNMVLTANALEIKKAMSFFYEVSTKANRSISFDASSEPTTKAIVVQEKQETETIYKNNISIRDVTKNYFQIIETVDMRYSQYVPQKSQYIYFPVWGFESVLSSSKLNDIKPIVIESIKKSFEKSKNKFQQITHNSITNIIDDTDISFSAKNQCIFYCVYVDQIDVQELKSYLKNLDINNSDYNKLISLYDMKIYGDSSLFEK